MATPPAGASCWICLEEDPDEYGQPLERNCACRGDAGWAHISCILSNAAYRYKRACTDRGRAIIESVDVEAIWTVCQHCKQEYQGDLNLAIATERVRFTELLPETDYQYISALMGLGLAKMTHGASRDYYGSGITDYETVLDILHANIEAVEFFFAKVKIDILAILAAAYRSSGDTERYSECMEEYKAFGEASGVTKKELDSFEQVMKAVQPDGGVQTASAATKVYENCVDIYGKDHASTLCAAQRLSTALIAAGKYRESIPLQRDTYERSRRMLGPEHPDTVGRRKTLFLHIAGYEPRKAKLSMEDPQMNGKEVVILRSTKDGQKYIVEVEEGSSTRKFKVAPQKLCFAEGTFVSVQTRNGDYTNAFVDSFDNDRDAYKVWMMFEAEFEDGYGHEYFAREQVDVNFTTSRNK